MSTPVLNTDIFLKLTCYLNLSSALALSQTCSSLYKLSLSSLSYWIHTTDVNRLPFAVSRIRDNYTPAQIRYMAKVSSAFGRNLYADDFDALEVSRCRFRNDGLLQLVGENTSSASGASSTFVQGFTENSLPWLVTVKGSILRCDCLNEKYNVGVQWDAGFIIDWFWRCDIYQPGDSPECIVVALTTNDSSGNLMGIFGNSGARVRTTKLHILKISLPSKVDLELAFAPAFVKQEHHMPFLFPTMHHKTPPVTQHEFPHPEVYYTTSIPLPPGFVNNTCRPASYGTRVYLMLKYKDETPHSFSAFVYDWAQNAGIRLQLPKAIDWRQTVAFSSMMILKDWKGPTYGIVIPSLHPLYGSETLDSSESNWYCPSSPVPLRFIHFEENITREPWDPHNVLAVIAVTNRRSRGTFFQVAENACYLISRSRTNLCCSLYRIKAVDGDDSSEFKFSRVASGFVDLGDSVVDQYISVEMSNSRSLVMTLRPPEDNAKKSVCFFVVDFEIDYDYDGRDGLKIITGIKRELRMEGQVQNVLGRKKALEYFAKENKGDVFFDGFRGTICVVGKSYKEAVLLKCTRV